MIFFKFFSLFILLGGYYLSARIIAGLKFQRKTVWAVRLIIFLPTLITAADRFFRGELPAPLALIAQYWVGILGTAFVVFALNDILILCNYLILKKPRFKVYSTFAALCCSIVLCAYGIVMALPYFTAVKTLHYKSRLLPERFTITLIADTHITNATNPREIQSLVKKVNALGSDIIVISGDLIDADISQTFGKFSLDKFSAPYGVFAVSGNHEYSRGGRFDSFLKVCAASGIKVLENESIVINNTINLAGVPDPRARRNGFETPNLDKALLNINPALPVVLLSHQPELFDLAAGKIFLQLSGHTHAGQTVPSNIIRKLFYDYFYGVYEKNGSYMYITSGTRYWGPPMRLFSRNEIVQVIIEK